MDGKGGCCIARYAGNAYDLSRMDRIMLRFRPIAPKPATESSGSGSSSAEKNIPCGKNGRGKRRYVRRNRKINDSNDGGSVSVTNKCKRKNGSRKEKAKSLSPEENESVNGRSSTVTGGDKDTVVTLSLLPETPDREESDDPVNGFFSEVEKVPLWLNFGSEESGGGGGFWMDRMAGMVAQPLRTVITWVNIECITETWVDYGYGCGGIGWREEGNLVSSLDEDTCPGFVSDGLDGVVWVNRAYREMVAADREEEVLVWLVFKEGMQAPPPPPTKSWPAGFTCRVRVVTCGKEKNSRTLPCDVWRLEGGRGFAWRLDVNAALSLGR